MVKTKKTKTLKLDFKCDTGLISENGRNKTLDIYDIGEFTDVFCVANSEKPLSALDFSAYGKRKLRKHDKTLINKVIQYSNSHNVKAIHTKNKKSSYLNTVFYKKNNYKNALKLTQLLHYDNSSDCGEKISTLHLVYC